MVLAVTCFSEPRRYVRLGRLTCSVRDVEPAEPTVRTFVGFGLHPDVQRRLWGKLQEWKKAGKVDGKLEQRAKLHVTLKFIGSMPESATEPLLQELRTDLAASRPLTVRIKGVGSFKSFRKFTVWAGVEEEAEGSLQELAARIDKVVHRQGLAQLDRRRLSPHVTLARKASNWAQSLKNEELVFGDTPVSCITLFESKSGHYLPLGTVDLAAEASDHVVNLAADADDMTSDLN